jgi:hypothetical protein
VQLQSEKGRFARSPVRRKSQKAFQMFSIQSTFASNGFQSSLERKNMAFSYWESTEWLEGNDLIVIGGGIVGLSAALQASVLSRIGKLPSSKGIHSAEAEAPKMRASPVLEASQSWRTTDPFWAIRKPRYCLENESMV